jgi:hypothetical protein
LQYKNGKNFINICYHKDEFGMDAKWQCHMAEVHVMELGAQLKAIKKGKYAKP